MEDSNAQSLKLVTDAAFANRQAYLHNFWATLGFLLVAIGWIFTSSEAQNLLELVKVRNVCVGVVGLLFIAHASVLGNAYYNSRNLLRIFKTFKIPLGEKDQKILVESYGIPWFWLPVNIVLNGLLFAFLAWQLFLPGVINNC